MHGDHLAKRVAIADLQRGSFAAIFHVLRAHTQHSLWEHFAALPELGISFDRRVVVDDAAIAQLDMGADEAERSHGNVFPQTRIWVHDSRRMNTHRCSTSPNKASNVVRHAVRILSEPRP